MSHATRSYVILKIPSAHFAFVQQRLLEAGYHQAFHTQSDGRLVIDMHGIALAAQPPTEETHCSTVSSNPFFAL